MISACPPLPTSWWPFSRMKPELIRLVSILSRRSTYWSLGATGKYPPLWRTL
ncbi:Uncharacterised protein [Mycobacterium tuberculosis]|uniref:Uncharacterized protein n=1 Tax=Mycobacterium tuberculosis TaxID=1773 RepID=A0A916L9I2_MYCTX|nr:Uncharacterised protein [Mycobacterium tuberculosis]COX41950.1 Uncharacterised protein [Mycobacterium tuberculosis]COX54319.1 Uncharacterised protein [Mycobacterium tuberculosis]